MQIGKLGADNMSNQFCQQRITVSLGQIIDSIDKHGAYIQNFLTGLRMLKHQRIAGIRKVRKAYIARLLRCTGPCYVGRGVEKGHFVEVDLKAVNHF